MATLKGDGGPHSGARRSEPRRELPPPPEPPRRGGNPWPFLTVLLVILALVGGFMWLRGLVPAWDNPFSERTVNRTQPPVLLAIRDMGEFRGATGNYQVVVDLEKDTKLPSEILGSRTLFVANGSVDAGIDLAGIGPEAVDVSQNGTAATITLPHAQLYDADMDLERSYVYDRDEGLFNRIGGVFTGDDEYEREALLAAEDKLNESARANGELTGRAEENTAAMLESLVRSLGFATVNVRFESGA